LSLPPEILKKVKLLEISTRKIVNSLFAGQYKSLFRGQGMTFSEFREYVPGDDVRTISWPVTARTGRVHIKKFDEEREMTLMLAIDVSGSLNFGSGEYIKGEIVAHLSALLGFAAIRNNDHVGLLLFSDQVEHFVPPKKGRGHVQRILRDIYYYEPKSTRTKISAGMDHLRGLLKKKATLFVMSDFRDLDFSHSLRSMAKKHEVIAVVVRDPLEIELPRLGLIDIQDAETGELLSVDTSSASFRRRFKEINSREHLRVENELKSAGVDKIDITSGADFVQPLISYFARKAARR
jgi:uncharacterized protein (DUF58 family)